MESIRHATPQDESEVIQIWAECGLIKPHNDPHEDFELALSNSTSSILILLDGTLIIGAVMVGFDGHRGWFYYLGIKPDFQNAGNGRILVTAAEDWLKQQGAPKSMLMVRHSNVAVIDFYKKLGYQVEETSVLGKRF